MKLKQITLIFLLICGTTSLSAKNLHSIKINKIGGKKAMDLQEYKRKTLLVVNIATQCGYTPQLEGLEALYQKYKSKNFEVLGVPSNEFGGQTPEENQEVKKFCKLNYGVSFPLTEKIQVKGDDKHPMMKNLIEQSEGSKEIGWNFEKFLVDSEGQLVARYDSKMKPTDSDLEKKVAEITGKN